MMIMVLNDDGGVDITKMNDPDLRQTEDHKHYRLQMPVIKSEGSSDAKRRELQLHSTKLTSI